MIGLALQKWDIKVENNCIRRCLIVMIKETEVKVKWDSTTYSAEMQANSQ